MRNTKDNGAERKGGTMIALSNGVEIKTESNGRIVWASDWSKLVLDHIRGQLTEVTSKFYRHLHGHTDYYLERRGDN